MYRSFSVGETEYSGRDGNKARGVDYIFDSFSGSLQIAGSSVLDLGCAGGGVSFRASALGAELVVGVERDERKLVQAKLIASQNDVDNITFFSESICEFLGRSERQFDYVFLLNIIHHLPNPQWVLERVAEVATKAVIVEGPLKRLYRAYAPDRGRTRPSLIPWGPKEEARFFGELGYEVKSSVLSPNAVSFIGGERSLRLYERKLSLEFNTGKPTDLEGKILIGPGASGKTFTVLEVMGMSAGQTCAPYKFRRQGILRKVADAVRGIERVAPAPPGSVFYIAPTVGGRALFLRGGWARLAGFKWNTRAWIELARKSNLPIVVCHASRKVRSERLLLRMQNRYLSGLGLQGAVEEILEIVRDKDLANREAKRRVRMIVPRGTARFVFEAVRRFYLPNLDFSYEKLFREMRSLGVPFEVLETGRSGSNEAS